MKYSILKFKKNEKFTMRDLEKFRGFLIDKYSNNTLFHNHINGGFDYSYPKLQYKLIKNTLSVLTIEETMYVNEHIFENTEHININGNIFFDFQKEIEIFEKKVVYSKDKMYEYKFVTPYLPLNEKNYKRYLKQEYTLDKAVTNNVLEVLKGLGIRLSENERLYAKTDLQSRTRVLKDVKMAAFTGTFWLNVKLPDYFSLGKRKSLGYGTFVKVSNNIT